VVGNLGAIRGWLGVALASTFVTGSLVVVAFLEPGADGWARTPAAIGLAAAAALLSRSALIRARSAMRSVRGKVGELRGQLVVVESTLREQRAQLHEIGSTLAGITSASRLVHEATVLLPSHRRVALREMIEAELSRLERLVQGGSDAQVDFAVDDVLRPLVVAQHAQSRSVIWEPSGALAHGCPDALAEAVNVLLNNAAKHGDNAGVSLRVRQVDAAVEIEVADSGPGISPDLRPHVFDWGVRGSHSSGQGIGLHVARSLIEQQGGYLRLQDSTGPGTTFTLGLRVGVSHDAVDQYAN
jgi:signal transduction histidine kinase